METQAIAILPDISIPLDLIHRREQFRGTSVNDCVHGDLILSRGRVVGMRPSAAAQTAPRLLFPALTEPHCHLDKCHTISRMPHSGGDLLSAIEAQMRDKAYWSETDIRTRARRGLDEAISAGCHTLRSHVDWGHEATPPTAWHVLVELAQESALTLQLSPLAGIDQMADPTFAATVARAVPDGHALGAFVLGHTQIPTGLRNMFTLAADHGLPLDFHVDETLDPEVNGLEAIADMALETRFDGPILCGHAVSLATRTPDEFRRIADKLARARITIVALPTTNLYLQGREPHAPGLRGLTPLGALAAAGVPILLGSDNVRDAFCPVGRHDPLYALELAILAGHLDPPFGRWLRTITTDARTALGMNPMPIDGAHLNDLRIADASDLSHLISGAAHRPATDLLKEHLQ